MLDLELGRVMLEQCNAVCPYYDQVIKNRKWCILEAALDAVDLDGITQVVILGAGMDALSIELASTREILDIYELDAGSMELKSEMIARTSERLADQISCIKHDLLETSKILNVLAKNGYDRTQPTLLIIEGVSYYIGDALFEIMGRFRSTKRHNRAILEYLQSDKDTTKRAHRISTRVFKIISDHTALPAIRYESGTIQGMLNRTCKGKITTIHNLAEIEMTRIGRNVYFPTIQSGWIGVAEIMM